MPIIIPHLEPAGDPGNEFLLAGLFPMNINKTNAPAPAELFDQFRNQPDMVYYDWEITQTRLLHWNQMFALFNMISSEPQIATEVTGRLWATEVSPNLGNTITQIVRKTPSELELVRVSHIGLTGFELMLLLHWQDHPEFPLKGLRLPMQPVRQGRIQMKVPVSPSPNRSKK